MLWVTETIAYNGQDLIDAAQRGDISSVKSLLNKGADMNAKNKNGWTASMLASKNGHTEIVQLLKKAGAKE